LILLESNIKISTFKGTLIMKRPLEFALGVIGGLIGIAAGLFGIVMGSMGSEIVGNLGISAIVFSVIGIICACIVVNSGHTKIAGWLMIIGALEIAALGIAGLGLTIGLLYYSLMSGIPLIIAGLMAAFKNTRV
jgi:hypothetical protein